MVTKSIGASPRKYLLYTSKETQTISKESGINYIYICIRIHDGLLAHRIRLSCAPTGLYITSALEREEVLRFSSDAIVETVNPL